jgi:hypothetical protein
MPGYNRYIITWWVICTHSLLQFSSYFVCVQIYAQLKHKTMDRARHTSSEDDEYRHRAWHTFSEDDACRHRARHTFSEDDEYRQYEYLTIKYCKYLVETALNVRKYLFGPTTEKRVLVYIFLPWVRVFNPTFNNISIISRRSVPG